MLPLAGGSVFALTEHEQLAWRGGPGPNYTSEEAAEGIRTRYERSAAMMQVTLPALVKDPTFRAIVATLRDEGWPDWQILELVANLALNSRGDTNRRLVCCRHGEDSP